MSGVYIAHLVRNSDPDDREPHHVRRARRRSQSEGRLPDLRRDLAGLQPLRRQQPLHVRRRSCPPGNPSAYKAAYKVSYNRPDNSEEDSQGARRCFGGAEYSMIRFLEANGYDVSYISGVDTHARGPLLLNHKLFLSSGHDEYWSKTAAHQRRGRAGRRREPRVLQRQRDVLEDALRAEHRRSHAPPTARSSPTRTRTSPSSRTRWPGPGPGATRASPCPRDDVTPENALTGQSFVVNSGTSRITVPAAYRQLRLWRNTGAGLTSGQNMTLAPDTLGYEWDVDADNGFRPAGSFKVSVDDGQRRRGRSPTTAAPRSSTAPRRTT